MPSLALCSEFVCFFKLLEMPSALEIIALCWGVLEEDIALFFTTKLPWLDNHDVIWPDP